MSGMEATPQGAFSADVRALLAEVAAARRMRDAIRAYEAAENRGFTKRAIQAFNAKEKANERYDAIRAASPKEIPHD